MTSNSVITNRSRTMITPNTSARGLSSISSSSGNHAQSKAAPLPPTRNLQTPVQTQKCAYQCPSGTTARRRTNVPSTSSCQTAASQFPSTSRASSNAAATASSPLIRCTTTCASSPPPSPPLFTPQPRVSTPPGTSPPSSQPSKPTPSTPSSRCTKRSSSSPPPTSPRS